MSIEKSIGWTDKTINPIKGMCKGGCWYCWSKPLYKRKFLQPFVHLNLDCFFKLPTSSRKIFLCSTHDLFGSWIPSWWRTAIFERIEEHPQHTFQILTKFPQNIDRAMPDNVWLGCSITGDDEQWSKGFDLYRQRVKIKFLSFEPLFQPIEIIDELWVFDWIIIGRLTGHGKKNQPEREWIQEIVDECKNSRTHLFMKDNLKEIWGEDLIQEMPG